ncbi:unnamed protein product [Linum trigynum]|uniref:Uncharacterized protein n=1 Tax=Linum trigynum TaxID=586398 RepID=A0AAV2E5C9_9ROSI
MVCTKFGAVLLVFCLLFSASFDAVLVGVNAHRRSRATPINLSFYPFPVEHHHRPREEEIGGRDSGRRRGGLHPSFFDDFIFEELGEERRG